MGQHLVDFVFQYLTGTYYRGSLIENFTKIQIYLEFLLINPVSTDKMSSVVCSVLLGTMKSLEICWPQIWNLTIPLPDAIVFAMQYCPLLIQLHMQSCMGLCKNLLADMYLTVLHVCARVSKRACTEPPFMQHEYFSCHSWHALTYSL